MMRNISIAMAAIAAVGLFSADASMKQMEIKGNTSLYGYDINYNRGAAGASDALRGGGSDAAAQMDVDLDFKMKFSQDVSARLDLEMDNATAGDRYFTGKSVTTATTNTANRFDIGIDQAYFKLADFLYKNFSLSIGKQDFNFSLRDNKSFSWSYGDPIAVVGSYATRDTDVKLYWAKLSEDNTLANATANAGATNDSDKDLLGSYLEYWLNDDSLVIGYLNYLSDNATSTNIIHYGLGIDYFVGESLELYGELAGESIDMAANNGTAMQITVGGEYAFSDIEWKPTLNLEYYLQTGADYNAVAGSTTKVLDNPAWQSIVGGMAAAENQSLFMEKSSARDLNMNVGTLSMGSTSSSGGYSVIRLNGWLSPKKDLKLGLGLHLFKDEDENSSTLASAYSDDLGLEIDASAKWKYSQDVTFEAGAFLWTGGESDGSAVARTAAGTKTDYEDVMGLVVGSSLKF